MRDFAKLASDLKQKAQDRNRALLPVKAEAKIKADHFDSIVDNLREHKTVQCVSAPQLFPTPRELALVLIELADIQPEHTILEPSAGTGQLADVILTESGIRPTCCEINLKLQSILINKGYQIAGSDFLEYAGQYDRIIMNPPFVNQQDIDHVTHAFELLAPGGRLVAVMSGSVEFRQDRKTTAFRNLIDQCGSIERNPDDSFKQSGTNVRTVTVILDREQS